MRVSKLAALALLLMASTPALADRVTCESQRNQKQECDMDTRGVVRLEEQLSKTRCVEGQNWGYSKHSIWVDGGCRGVFVSDTGSDYSQGESYHSPSHRQNNDYQSGSYYPEDLPTNVTCESIRNGKTECDMDTRGEVRLVRQLSNSPCREGDSWGYSKHSIWVDRGCRAVFQSDGGGSSGGYASGGPTNEQIAACNSVQDWYGEVVESSPLEPGAFEIILDYGNRGRYVCNVERDGTVTYFERLR